MAVQRRLAAILVADVAGYSRLMGEDEAGTRGRFNAHLHELIGPAIASRRGHFAKPVRAYRVWPEGQEATALSQKKAPSRRRISAIAAAVLVVIGAGGVAWA